MTTKIGSSKQNAYQNELRARRIKTAVAGSVLLIASLFFIMIICGDYFNPVLKIFGLRGWKNDEGGVYTDCSLPENKSISYCQPKADPNQKKWDSLKQGGETPFTLHGN